ncbi:MAG: PKD domain-containing protein, partial [Oleispira antarctica]|nr:PKD domain-containing protein [Oleispira antarctica]
MSFASIKFSIIATIMMALTGCFSVELTAPDSIEQNSIFTMTATPTDNEGDVSYQWSINNSVISENSTHHTMLTALGEYTLTVVAIDEKGNEDTQTKTVSVVAQPSLTPDFSFAINVSDKEGFAITEAPVTINGITVITDQYGLAQFDGISQTSLMLVSASKEGYLTQTYQYNFDAAQENATATLTLQSINPISHIVDSSVAIEITEIELHTKLILAANSFVDANGNPVTGDIEVTITPVDVRAVDNAFLGGAQALTTSGEPVALISTGMA